MELSVEKVQDICILCNNHGSPDIVEGKCQGFQRSEEDDEPSDLCRECPANIFYEE